MSKSEQNLKFLKDIQDYITTHESDYYQVYFSPASATATKVPNAGTTSNPIKVISGDHNVQTCSASAAQEGAQYFALNSNNSCEIYSSDHISNMPVIIKDVWQIELPAETSYVCLDMLGNLNAYSAKHQVLATIIKVQDQANKQSKSHRFRMVLLDSKENYLQPIRIQLSKTEATYASITIKPVASLELTQNPEWNKDNYIVRSITNKEQQEGSKRVSVDKITLTNALVSNNYKYKLSIESNPLRIVLQASYKNTQQIYKMNSDEKLGKLYYAGTYPEHKFLKEVPGSMQTLQSGNYSTYQDVYPDINGQYTKTEGNDCKLTCDNDVGCNAVYTVVDSVSKKTYCFTSNKPPTFNAKQGEYDSSILYVKNPTIKSNDTAYAKATYVADAYESEFKTYTPSGVIDAKFIAGPNGAPYIQELKNKVVASTFGPNIKEGVVQDDAINKLNTISFDVNKYIQSQTDISNNRYVIEQKLNNINRVYQDMSNDNTKYDFTTKDAQNNPISNIIGKEDYSFDGAINKDNAIYTNEQQNLYAIATLTMATLLVMAIII